MLPHSIIITTVIIRAIICTPVRRTLRLFSLLKCVKEPNDTSALNYNAEYIGKLKQRHNHSYSRIFLRAIPPAGDIKKITGDLPTITFKAFSEDCEILSGNSEGLQIHGRSRYSRSWYTSYSRTGV